MNINYHFEGLIAPLFFSYPIKLMEDNQDIIYEAIEIIFAKGLEKKLFRLNQNLPQWLFANPLIADYDRIKTDIGVSK